VVTTRNSAKTLEACLRSVRNQTVPRLTVVVVDNFSRDGTPTIGRRLADRFEQAGPERSRQRNLGAGMTSGTYLLFLDSDMVLQPSVVEECLAETGRGAGAVIIPEVSAGEGYWAACKALERSCYVGDDTIEAPRFIKRRVFDELAGFDEELTGEEDWDLAVRIRQSGARVGRTKTPLWHDEGRLTLGETMRAKYYYGRTMRQYMRKQPEAARSQLRLFRPAYFRHLDLLARRPWLTAGMFLMKTSEIAAGGLGVLAGWRQSRRVDDALGP
jgi:glycosyltransferase involved in cell wall biosynthesis